MFGHSFGGLVALRVARTYPLTKLAVYEPAVSVDGSLPTPSAGLGRAHAPQPGTAGLS